MGHRATPGRRPHARSWRAFVVAATLIFNEGYAATRGEDWMRPDLCEAARRQSLWVA